jgi:hypothetical protein
VLQPATNLLRQFFREGFLATHLKLISFVPYFFATHLKLYFVATLKMFIFSFAETSAFAIKLLLVDQNHFLN